MSQKKISRNIMLKRVLSVAPYEYRLTMIIAKDARHAFQTSKVDPELKRLWQNPFAARFVYDDGLSGTLFFQADSLSYDTIAHEIFHAVHRLFEQIGDSISPTNHEAFAYLLSYLVKWVVKQCRDAGIKIHDA